NAERMNRLVDDFLTLEKMKSGAVVLERETLNVAEVINEAVANNTGFAKAQAIGLRSCNVDGAATIYADKDMVSQVLDNLISNALKFSPKGGEVVVNAFPTNGHDIRIEVIDEGSGVPADFLPSLFDKFAQADGANNRKKGGTGLGLSKIGRASCRERV